MEAFEVMVNICSPLHRGCGVALGYLRRELVDPNQALPPSSPHYTFLETPTSHLSATYRAPDRAWYISQDRQLSAPRNSALGGAPFVTQPPLLPQQQQAQYTWSIEPARTPIPIDPALLPLPDSSDVDLRHPLTIAQLSGLPRADKVAGSRANGKRHARSSDRKGKKRSASSDLEGTEKKRRGRRAGTTNYGASEVNHLLNLAHKRRPGGGKAWESLAGEYNTWALSHDFEERTSTSLTNKLNALARTTKPTGSRERPAKVKRALEIMTLINERTGARNLDDLMGDSADEMDDDPHADDPHADNSDDSVTFVHGPVRTAVARRAPSPPLSRQTSRQNATHLANTLAHSLGPEGQMAREEARSRCTYENAQLFSLTQQLRDVQAELSRVRSELSESQRARDCAQLKLEMIEEMGSHASWISHSRTHSPHPCNRGRSSKKKDYQPIKFPEGADVCDGKMRITEKLEGGGEVTWWAPKSETEWSPSPRPVRRCRSPTCNATPGPSHQRNASPSHSHHRSPSPVLAGPLVTGDAIQVVMTPHKGGPSVGFIISPSKDSSMD